MLIMSTNIIKHYTEQADPTIFNHKLKTFNIKVADMNYIFTKIVEWTRSDKPFDDFINDIKDDDRFCDNLLLFLWCLPRTIDYHLHYMIYVISKLAEHFEWNGLLYLICSNYFIIKPFDHNYIRLINKRFNEHHVCVDNTIHNVIDSYITKIDDNKEFSDFDIITCLNPPDVFINWCILSNDILLFKRMMLFINHAIVFHKYRHATHLSTNRIDTFVDNILYWPIDYYMVVRQLYPIEQYMNEYKLLVNPMYCSNEDITNNFNEFYAESTCDDWVIH